MKKQRDEAKYETIRITKVGGEQIVLRNFDENGIKEGYDIELEKDKFLHPEKYEKEEKASR